VTAFGNPVEVDMSKRKCAHAGSVIVRRVPPTVAEQLVNVTVP
jgi:hypothetical protein